MNKFVQAYKRLHLAAFFSILLAGATVVSDAGTVLAATAVVSIPENASSGSTSKTSDSSGSKSTDGAGTSKTSTQEVAYRKKMVTINGDTYYYLSNGKRAVSRWIKYKSKKYYFGADGKMVRNAWVGKYYVDLKGQRCKTVTKKKVLKGSTKQERQSGKKLIIVGASRVLHMKMYVSYDKQTVYICRRGAGIKFLLNNAGPRLCAYLSKFPNSTVVFQFGNNNLSEYKKVAPRYFKYYRTLMNAFPNADFYFMDALPGRTRKKNKLRIKFNRLLQNAFPNEYIGGYDYLMSTGISFTSDGEHYKPVTCYKIYDYIIKRTNWVS